MEQSYNHSFAFSEEIYSKWAEPILRQVFLNDNPFGDCVNPSIIERLIIYPIWSIPEKKLLEAIFLSAKRIGDDGCFLTNLNRYHYNDAGFNKDDDINDPSHCYIPLIESEKFFVDHYLIQIYCDSVYYSASGRWGLMISHEHHGILCGCSAFMKSMKSLISDLDRQIYLWLSYFREENLKNESFGLNGLTIEWLPDLLRHIYGSSYANTLLDEIRLD